MTPREDVASQDDRTLEQALGKTETDAAATIKAAGTVMASLRRMRAAAREGNLRELRTSIEASENALAALRQQFANAREGWAFDEERYLAEGAYARELMAVAERQGVKVVERDERLYCYPVLIRVSPSDRAVSIDKKREARIRPSVLVSRLQQLQRKPPRFRTEPFLAALFEAYSKAVAMRGKDMLSMAPVIPLADIYEMLTMLPGQAREYSKQEFARDVYLLHRSGVDATRNGAKVSFPISRGVQTKTFAVIDETGEEKRYYGISFTVAS